MTNRLHQPTATPETGRLELGDWGSDVVTVIAVTGLGRLVVEFGSGARLTVHPDHLVPL